MKQTLLIPCGAAAGGIIGYFVFFWIAAQGFYGLALPGGMIGLGAGIGKNRSILVAVCSGLAATALGLFTEWRYAPFVDDDSLGYFVRHFYELKPITLVMILFGGLIGFWVPFRRRETGDLPDRRHRETPQIPANKHYL
ncbi:MAG TPA: hypothetical protein VGP68_17385 [Gemmataceae bacterium]|jgi:hypothetical protein|nr:hypothetical protein [Gemmataceae bacterium]